MNNIFNETGTYVWSFGDVFLVVCPVCDKRAAVHSSSVKDKSKIRLTCLHCGLVKDWKQRNRGIKTANDHHLFKEGEVSIGAPVDWYFHHQLWLQSLCCGEILWAYNADHLKWLKAFVSSDIRERKYDGAHGWSNQSLASRLPKWIKSRKNRERILLGLSRLEKRAH